MKLGRALDLTSLASEIACWLGLVIAFFSPQHFGIFLNEGIIEGGIVICLASLLVFIVTNIIRLCRRDRRGGLALVRSVIYFLTFALVLPALTSA